jgi:Ca2+-transporting ATPase
MAALMAVLYVPGLRQVLGFGLVRPLDLAIILGAGVVGVSWFEIYKWFRRGRAGKTSVSGR